MHRFAVLVVLLAVVVPIVRAQTPSRRFEAGAHGSLLSPEYPDETRAGVGAWFGFRPLERLVVETALTLAPGNEPPGGRISQFLAGVRTGASVGPVGMYGRVRPGVTHFGERFVGPPTVCILIFPPPESCFATRTNFTLDLGGTLEVSPSPRTLLRFDAGDALIRFGRFQHEPAWKHNLQITAGAGMRF